MRSRRLKIALVLSASAAGMLIAVCFAWFGIETGPGGETWHAVAVDDGFCSALLPRRIEYREIPSGDSRPPVREWSGWLEESSYSIAIIPVESRPKQQQLDLIENSAVELAAEYDGHVIRSVPAFVDGYEGRRQLIDTGSIIFDQYMFVVGQKAITAKADYRTGMRPTRLVEYFLANFRINNCSVNDEQVGIQIGG
ncbi:hypothetical protein [Crateriforma spongiae]|uniref:hypothetical protein n=1 Tax=Crateriforma spongiae TaxID=2724528 RepID=UPI001444F3E3|nr:hypothetical protein [Crateriforma spongiae]